MSLCLNCYLIDFTQTLLQMLIDLYQRYVFYLGSPNELIFIKLGFTIHNILRSNAILRSVYMEWLHSNYLRVSLETKTNSRDDSRGRVSVTYLKAFVMPKDTVLQNTCSERFGRYWIQKMVFEFENHSSYRYTK